MMSRLLGSFGLVMLMVSLSSFDFAQDDPEALEGSNHLPVLRHAEDERQAPGAAADLVLLDAKILTVDARFGQATAAAVRDGRFVAVGSNEDVRPLIGRGTRVIEGRGRTVLPGLIDTHVHALDVAAAEIAQPYQNLQSIDALQAWIRSAVRSGPSTGSARSGQAVTWIWTPRIYPTRLRDRRFPTRQELDAAASDRPV